MLKKTALLRAIITTTFASGLVACGGGGSSSSGTSPAEPTPPSENTGNFIDSPVGGLEYEAKPSGITGVTGDDGSFRYRDGDSVYFRVGNYFVGSANAAKIISPKSIGLNDEDAVANIARFLQTLDDDGIVENGITINNAAREEARNATGGEVSALDLSSDSVKTGILELTKENSVPRTELVDRASALGHLNQTLNDFRAASIATCSEDAPAVEASRIADKTFGRIAEGEITLFTFENEGNKIIEIANDEGELKTGEGTWALDGQGKTMTLEFPGDAAETISLCDAGNSIILESGDTSNKFYDVVPANASAGSSFLLSYVTDNDDTGALLELTANNDYEIHSGTEVRDGVWAEEDKTLKLKNGEDGEIYFLAGQNNRIGILVEQGTNGLSNVGTATQIPTLSDPSQMTLAGNSFLLRNEGENSVYMLDFANGSTFTRYTNESDTGNQVAAFSTGEWTLNQNELVLTSAEGEIETFLIWDAGNLLFVADKGDNVMARLYKTQPVTSSTFTGTYNVNIPTENVKDNKLVINDDRSCSYDGTACEWTINAKGHAILNFPGQPEQGQVWQVAGSSSAFGFVITHEDKLDIEPGFMTRN